MMPLPSPSHRTKLTLSLKFVSWIGFSWPSASTRQTWRVPVAFERYATVFPSGEKLGDDDARMLRYFSIGCERTLPNAERVKTTQVTAIRMFCFIFVLLCRGGSACVVDHDPPAFFHFA